MNNTPKQQRHVKILLIQHHRFSVQCIVSKFSHFLKLLMTRRTSWPQVLLCILTISITYVQDSSNTINLDLLCIVCLFPECKFLHCGSDVLREGAEKFYCVP